MSLLAWYPLIANGNNQGLDGIDLTPIGTITYTAGKLGKAATFTQNLANRFRRTQIKIKDNFSFACWFKLDTTESTTWQTLLFEGRDVNSDGWGFRINGSTKRLIYCCGSSTWTYGTDLTMGQWYHATMVIKDGVYTAYLNGTQVNTASITTLPALTEWGTYFYVSCLSDNYYPLMGQVQDVRIYDHPLSKKEVKDLSKGLTIHMPMDWDGNTNILPDSPVATNSTETDSTLGRTVYVRSTTATGESYIWGGRSDVVEQSTKYTLSAWVWVNEYVKSVEVFWLSTNTTNKKTGTAYDSVTVKPAWTQTPNTWQYITWTFTTKADDYTGVIRWDNNGSSTSGTAAILKVYNMKIEKGEKATPFVPHKNDSFYNGKGFGVNYKDECSGYNRGITTSGTAMIGEESPRGTGTYCTSGCYLQATSGFPLSPAMSSWTIALWFKPDIGKTFTSWSDVFRFWMNTETGNNTHFRLETQNSSGNNYCLYYNNSGASSYGGGALTTITENKWYHLAFCCDSTKIYQYVNSELKITHTINTGYKPTGPTGYFQIGDGGMYASYADVRVYATCLSADDIKELYQIPVQIDKTGKIYCNNLVEV